MGILLRFREEPVAFMGDISKMHLQICLPESDTHLHRYLWRDLDVTKPPTVYRLLRVTFGDKPSPEMANFVMRKIAETTGESYPEAAVILNRDRYMDDIIHSCESTNLAEKLTRDIDTVLATGSFKIKEWFHSKSSEEKETDLDCQNLDNVKTLGVSWNCSTDTIHFRVKDLSVEL